MSMKHSPIDSALLSHAEELARGQRYEFGRNWTSYLGVLNEERILCAQDSLSQWLGDLSGKTFVDIGCGSGIMSLAAARLRASQITSVDFDPKSVACARELKRNFFREWKDWTILEGNCLDRAFINSLPRADIVYIWGVAHHTGDMWRALENAATRVRPSGQLFTAIYNDRGFRSRCWRQVKRIYCSGRLGRCAIIPMFFSWYFFSGFVADIIRLRSPFRRYKEYRKKRGMSLIHDWYDWLGGYPFEVASPDDVFYFLKERGFQLERLKTVNGDGNNQFLFRKPSVISG